MSTPVLLLLICTVLCTFSFSTVVAFLPSVILSRNRKAQDTESSSKLRQQSYLPALKEATFGMGCFWEPTESLLKQTGIVETAAGYTGAPNNKKVPNYDNVCFGKEWVEGVRIVYNDAEISYSELLDQFMIYQKPGYQRQYASVVFFNDKEEERIATKWKEAANESVLQQRKDNNLSYDIVSVEPASSFFKAEEYHQRYWDKQRLRAFAALLLLAASSGSFDSLFNGALTQFEIQVAGESLSFDGLCNVLFVAGALWTLLERFVQEKGIGGGVKELEQGDLASGFAPQRD